MTLAVPVEHPARATTILLRSNVTLDTHAISRLRELGVGHVWIRHPSLEFVVEHSNPAVMRACGDLALQIGKAWDAVRDRPGARLHYQAYERAVSSLLERLAETPKAGVFVDQITSAGSSGMRHAANVCFLSLIMGLKLEFYLVRERSRLTTVCARDVTNLGVGALLHDIGMARADDETARPWREGRDDATGEWRGHVIAGFEMVKSDVDPSAAAVVLHHHQHMDGSGFPAMKEGVADPNGAATVDGKPTGLTGSDIHVFARIVAVADLFDRLRYPPGIPEQNCPTTVSVLKRMQDGPCAKWFDPVVFRSLVSVAPPYAPGVWVTLSDGRSAVVESWTPAEPCRPVVRVMDPLQEESLRKEVPSERIDLRTARELEIAKIEGREVLSDNFYTGKDREYDLKSMAKGMINAAA